MPPKSVYLPSPHIENDLVHISDEEHHHLAVARAEPDEVIELFDGLGHVWTARVVSLGRRETVVRIQASRLIDRDPVEVILGLALIRTAAFELALEKAVEVGVSRIIPFAAARSNAAWPTRDERRTRIMVEAAKQSKRYYLPGLDSPVKFDEIVRAPAASKIMFALDGRRGLGPALAGSPVLYLIGPEGGWVDEEIAAARENGFAMVSLGDGILRAETAAVVGGALIRYELGNR